MPTQQHDYAAHAPILQPAFPFHHNFESKSSADTMAGLVCWGSGEAVGSQYELGEGEGEAEGALLRVREQLGD